jgi:hypothetical protein
VLRERGIRARNGAGRVKDISFDRNELMNSGGEVAKIE